MSQIQYSSKSIQGAVVRMAFGTRMLRAVNANWNANDSGWNLNANSVSNPNRWNDGNRVFSRNCCIFSLFMWREFCFQDPFSNRLASVRFRQAISTVLRIFSYPKLLIPTQSAKRTSINLICRLLFATPAVFALYLNIFP